MTPEISDKIICKLETGYDKLTIDEAQRLLAHIAELEKQAESALRLVHDIQRENAALQREVAELKEQLEIYKCGVGVHPNPNGEIGKTTKRNLNRRSDDEDNPKTTQRMRRLSFR